MIYYVDSLNIINFLDSHGFSYYDTVAVKGKVLRYLTNIRHENYLLTINDFNNVSINNREVLSVCTYRVGDVYDFSSIRSNYCMVGNNVHKDCSDEYMKLYSSLADVESVSNKLLLENNISLRELCNQKYSTVFFRNKKEYAKWKISI